MAAGTARVLTQRRTRSPGDLPRGASATGAPTIKGGVYPGSVVRGTIFVRRGMASVLRLRSHLGGPAPGVFRFEFRVAVAADGEEVPRVEPLRRIVVPLHQVMHLGGGPRVADLAEGVIRPHEER
jgi:hypothetical protein